MSPELPHARDGLCHALETEDSRDRVDSGEPLLQAEQGTPGKAPLNSREEELKRTLEFEVYFENSLDLLCITDLGGRMLRLNSEWEKTLGYGRKELENRNFIDLVHSEDRAATVAVSAELSQGRSVSNFVNRVRHKDGSYRWIEWRSFPAGTHVYAAARDITEHKHTEEARLEMERQLHALNKLESLDAMAGGIAHDFNNLLMAIQGGIELAMNDISPKSAACDVLKTSLVAVQRAAELTGQMLTYSGKNHLQVRQADLNDIVQGCLPRCRAAIGPSVELAVHRSGTPCVVHVDAMQIQQVLLNVVCNASEAIGEADGRIEIRVGIMDCDAATLKRTRLGERPPPGRYAFVEVRDSGAGMDAPIIARLFEPFFSTKFVGRGLGLSAASGILRAHRGAVLVDSELGRGSSFRILLPTDPNWQARRPARSSSNPPFAQPSRSPDKSRTILLAEDEPLVAAACSRALTRFGYRVVAVTDGQQAVEEFSRLRDAIDIVLLDMAMPQLNGIEAGMRIREINASVPIILSSGYLQASAGSDVGSLGFQGFIQKPYDFASLRALLTTALEGVTPLPP